jgi:hypothetical protein
MMVSLQYDEMYVMLKRGESYTNILESKRPVSKIFRNYFLERNNGKSTYFAP